MPSPSSHRFRAQGRQRSAAGKPEPPSAAIRKLLERYSKIEQGSSYYQVAIGMEALGVAEWHVQTAWTGWEDDEHRVEHRMARPVDPYWLAECWAQSAQPYFVVNDAGGLLVFLAFGGTALVRVTVAKKFLPDVIEKTREAAGKDGFHCEKSPFISTETEIEAETLRAQVIERDGGQCGVCKVLPKKAGHSGLRVLPVRPFAVGGRATVQNHLTVCLSCAQQFQRESNDGWAGFFLDGKDLRPPYLEMSRYCAFLVAHGRNRWPTNGCS